MDNNYNYEMYEDIARRTNGEIYLGIVGPVRTGKSTFIRRFMELMVLPNLTDEYAIKRMQDELPQSSAGNTIMTTEPKFVPNDSVTVELSKNVTVKLKLIDCVGFLANGATGYEENGVERKVNTPWSEDVMNFTVAAEYGTEKVITDHSTIGIVMTSDGSITDISRHEYEIAEKKAINKLKSINKPFIVLLNSQNESSEETLELANSLQEEYGVSVMPINALEMNKEDINKIFQVMLFEFPICEINLKFPRWFSGLGEEDDFKNTMVECLLGNSTELHKMQDLYPFLEKLESIDRLNGVSIANIDLGTGKVNLNIEFDENLFYSLISKELNMNIENEYDLINKLRNLSLVNENYMKFRDAIDEVTSKGYGVVIPRIEELKIENPEIIRQGNKYGVRIMVKAPSIHMIETNVEAEISPIVGNEEQSKDLIDFINKACKEDPNRIWDINVFGKTINELIKDELKNKLEKLSEVSKERFQVTLQRVINEGTGNLICIII